MADQTLLLKNADLLCTMDPAEGDHGGVALRMRARLALRVRRLVRPMSVRCVSRPPCVPRARRATSSRRKSAIAANPSPQAML